jgi:hypothetical protein
MTLMLQEALRKREEKKVSSWATCVLDNWLFWGSARDAQDLSKLVEHGVSMCIINIRT